MPWRLSEREAFARFLGSATDADRYRFSPRLARLKAISPATSIARRMIAAAFLWRLSRAANANGYPRGNTRGESRA
jgi:hypothetical protein